MFYATQYVMIGMANAGSGYYFWGGMVNVHTSVCYCDIISFSPILCTDE